MSQQTNKPEPAHIWLNTQIHGILGFDAIDIANHVKQLDDQEASKSLQELLGSDKNIKKVINTYLEKRRNTDRVVEIPKDAKVYIKNKQPEEVKKKPQAQKKENTIQEPKEGKGKRNRGVPLGSIENIILPGRVSCDCQSIRHPLLTNCLGCGKIICEQEGYGPCLFCGYNVNPHGKSSQPKTQTNSDYEKAVKHKDTLIGYDRTAASRTMVLDDQADYFSASTNQWMDPKERDRLVKLAIEEKQKQEEEKRKIRVTFDFAGRKVVVKDASQSQPPIQTPTSQQSSSSNSKKSHQAPNPSTPPEPVPLYGKKLENPFLTGPAPIFTPSTGSANKQIKTHKTDTSSKRIQHQYFGIEAASSFNQEVHSSLFKFTGLILGPYYKKDIITPNEPMLEILIELMSFKSAKQLIIPLELVTPNLIQRGKKSGISIIVGINIISDFNFSENLNIEKLIESCTNSLQSGCEGIALFFQPSEDIAKSTILATTHCNLANTIIKGLKLKKETKMILSPAVNGLDFDLGIMPSQNEIEYLKQLNKSVDTKYLFSLFVPEMASSSFLKQLDKRGVIIVQQFPKKNKNFDTGNLVCYSPPNYLQSPSLPPSIFGIVVNPLIDDNLALFSISTFLDYASSPYEYDPSYSFETGLLYLLKDERITEDLAYVLLSVDNKVLEQAAGLNLADLSSRPPKAPKKSLLNINTEIFLQDLKKKATRVIHGLSNGIGLLNNVETATKLTNLVQIVLWIVENSMNH